jgi:serine/threonine protein kinase
VTDSLHDRVVAAAGSSYLIENEIGRGGMAVVYRAVDLRLNRAVAIKVLPPELAFNNDVRTRFLREAQTSAQLTHPNIVPIYTVNETEGIVYFVMALVDGDSLAAILARDPRRPVDQVRRVLCEVADALEYAHRHGVIHRDIKPDNIIIDRVNGRSMVTDFGIARAAAAESRLTVTGVAVGTPAYMSPEQALGERELDGRSDIYSLGVVGYQMLVGETPFKATNTPAMLVKHVSEIPRPVRDRRADAPALLAAAVDRALAKKPEDRWTTAEEFRQAVANTDVADVRASVRVAAPRPEPSAVVAPPPSANNNNAGVRETPYDGERRMAPMTPPIQWPQIQAPPPGLDKRELRHWKREQRKLSRERWRLEAERLRQDVGDAAEAWFLERRVRRYRKHLALTSVVVPTLFTINALQGGEPWFLVPTAVLSMNVLVRAAALWADGIGPLAALKSGTMQRLRKLRASSAPPAMAAITDPAASLVPADVLSGPHGEVVRRAASDREFVKDVITKLGPVEKELLPDVTPTVDALTERVAALAVTLHRLDADVSGASLGQLDQRISALQQESPTADRERRLALLQRQRASLHDLLDRRRALANQLESASLALQNLKLDLLKLRSAGVGSALEDVTSATREARALSRDISNLLEAADDVRRM